MFSENELKKISEAVSRSRDQQAKTGQAFKDLAESLDMQAGNVMITQRTLRVKTLDTIRYESGPDESFLSDVSSLANIVSLKNNSRLMQAVSEKLPDYKEVQLEQTDVDYYSNINEVAYSADMGWLVPARESNGKGIWHQVTPEGLVSTVRLVQIAKEQRKEIPSKLAA